MTWPLKKRSTGRSEKNASRRAGILVCDPDYRIGDFLETDTGFVWVEVAGLRVYSCYSLRVTLIVSHLSGVKLTWIGGEY